MNRKSQIFIAVILIMANIARAQVKSSCCQMSSVTQFAEFGKDISFVIAHQEPLPFQLTNPAGKDINFPVAGENNGRGYYIKGSKKSTKWIYLFHEWWGLNDYIRLEADKLHKAFPHAHILAIDLYDGKLAIAKEHAAAFMQAVKPERVEKIIAGASTFSGEGSKIATIGWCFGGAWSLKSSILLGDKSTACVMYYGMPVNDETQLLNLKAPVLGLFAEQDGWITPTVVDDFKGLMNKLEKSIEIVQYDAAHAFANPSNPKYNKEFTKDAMDKSISFIKKHLNP